MTKSTKSTWEVIVGNIGTVYSGTNGFEANTHFQTYVGQSNSGYGRAAAERKTLMSTIGTEIIDGDTMLIKSSIERDEPSICIEDFCGYTNPGHFPISMSADYYPRLGFTRFIGAWWNVPDMPCTSEPSELDINKWARKHGAECTYVPSEQ